MKFLILKDKSIRQEQAIEVERQFTDIIYENTDITPSFIYQDYDFTTYPKVKDSDGDEHVSDAFLKDTCAKIFKDKGESIDHVVFWIHRNNWSLEGVWGTAYSNIFSGYQVHVCRFDHLNLVNALGTFYHEVMHVFDSFITRYIGFNINTLGYWGSWDKHVVHGGRPDEVGKYKWGYIRQEQNTDALAYIAPYLRQAYAKRHKAQTQKTLISTLQKLVDAYKALLNQKSTKK